MAHSISDWSEAFLAVNGIPEHWMCTCHNGQWFTGSCKEEAENRRAYYYGIDLPHFKVYGYN